MKQYIIGGIMLLTIAILSWFAFHGCFTLDRSKLIDNEKIGVTCKVYLESLYLTQRWEGAGKGTIGEKWANACKAETAILTCQNKKDLRDRQLCEEKIR